MQVQDLIVEVRQSDLTRVGVIPSTYLVGFEVTLRKNNVGNWSINLPSDFALADELRATGAGIVVSGPYGVIISGPTVSSTLSKTIEDPEGIWSISGVSDNVVLSDRLAYPQPNNVALTSMTQTADIRTGVASSVMCQYVDYNVGVNAHVTRKISSFIASVNPVIGSTITGAARFEILGELLTNLASIDDLNFSVVQQNSNLVFKVFAAVDRSATVRMDIHNNTLSKSEYGYAAPGLTRAIVGGSGDGTTRTFVNVSTTESVSAETEKLSIGPVTTHVG